MRKIPLLAILLAGAVLLFLLYGGVDSIKTSLVDTFSGEVEGISEQAESPASVLAAEDGSFIKGSSPRVYYVEGGVLRPFTSAKAFLSWADWGDITAVGDDVIGSASVGPVMGFKDGTLLKGSGKRIYIVKDQERRGISSLDDFENLGLSFGNVMTVSQGELDLNPEGALVPTTYPGGSLVKGGDPDVYRISDAKLRYIPASEILTTWGDWDDVVTVSDDLLGFYGSGETLGFANGTVVKSDSSNTVYVISGSAKRAFLGWDDLVRAGYSGDEILVVNAAMLQYNSDGAAVSLLAEGAVFKGSGLRVYRAGSDGARYFPSAAIFESWSRWSDIQQISGSDAGVYKQRGPIGFKDGVLVRARNSAAIYLIEGGLRRPFANWDAFAGRGYNIRDVWVVGSSELQYNAVGDPITDPAIRVGIYKTTGEIRVTGNGTFYVRDTNGTTYAQLGAGNEVRVSYSSGKHRVRGSGLNVNVSAPIRVEPAGGTIMTITSYEDRPPWNPSLNDNEFRGVIEARRSDQTGEFWAINELPLEDYLKGIAEASNSVHSEALKVMSIAERTYALHHVRHGGKHPENYFHVDNRYDQVYKGYGFEKRGYAIVAAVQATRGKVVTYGGNVAITPYFSQSDGRTRSWGEVWGGGENYPWLVSVSDPYCAGLSLLGHGVGLSAKGARLMAEHGSSYSQILKHYYTGVQIQKLY